jgi:murein DD-endopeptidase MepM/ murein hydrolase activator NlpD
LAAADSTVVTARDGLPENVPGHNEGFSPAVPITPDTIAGNTLLLDLGGQQFAHYLHLQSGSLRVKTGDHVRRGQVVAQIGDSGDAREPHLHFQVSTSSNLLAGEGVPYLIDQYSVKSKNDSWQMRTRELPLGGMLIDFGRGRPRTASKRAEWMRKLSERLSERSSEGNQILHCAAILEDQKQPSCDPVTQVAPYARSLAVRN